MRWRESRSGGGGRWGVCPADILVLAVGEMPEGAVVAAQRQLLGMFDELRRHLLDRQHKIHQPGGDGAVRHAVETRGDAGLSDGEPAMLLDCLDAERAVAAAAGENDADRILLLVLGER